MVYKWFYLIYKASVAVGLFGYVSLILTLIGVNVLFGHKPNKWMDVSLVTLFYGLYFGVLGRDVAEYCSERMAASIGVSCINECIIFLIFANDHNISRYPG